MNQEVAYAKKCLPKDNREKIYCWEDSKGTTHFSNLGFPSGDNFTQKWVKHF